MLHLERDTISHDAQPRVYTDKGEKIYDFSTSKTAKSAFVRAID